MRSLCCGSATNACWRKSLRTRTKFWDAIRARIWPTWTGFSARAKPRELMEAGVTIYLPETVVIDPEVSAGPDTVIDPCVQLLGKTRIGARCTIQTGSVLRDTRAG